MTERNLLDMVCEIVKTDKDRLEKNEFGKIEVDSFNLNDFWDQFGAAVQALSNEVTKVGFMCGKKPYPQKQELDGMLQDMMQYYNMTKELFLVLPEEVGETVYGAVRRALRDIMAALMAIVTSLHDLTDKGARERLALTGTFWDACNAVESLPKNNLSAVLKVLEEETALATDAKEELETVASADSQSDVVDQQAASAELSSCEAHKDAGMIEPPPPPRETEYTDTLHDQPVASANSQSDVVDQQAASAELSSCEAHKDGGKIEPPPPLRWTEETDTPNDQPGVLNQQTASSTDKSERPLKKICTEANRQHSSNKPFQNTASSMNEKQFLPVNTHSNLEMLTMVAPLPQSSDVDSREFSFFSQMFPKMSAAEVVKSVELWFPKELSCDKWVIHKDRRDSNGNLHVTLSVDSESLKVLEKYNYKLYFNTSKYNIQFEPFISPSISSHFDNHGSRLCATLNQESKQPEQSHRTQKSITPKLLSIPEALEKDEGEKICDKNINCTKSENITAESETFSSSCTKRLRRGMRKAIRIRVWKADGTFFRINSLKEERIVDSLTIEKYGKIPEIICSEFNGPQSKIESINSHGTLKRLQMIVPVPLKLLSDGTRVLFYNLHEKLLEFSGIDVMANIQKCSNLPESEKQKLMKFDRWEVYSERRDHKGNFYIDVGVDRDTLMALEMNNFVLKMWYKNYYLHFKQTSTSGSCRY